METENKMRAFVLKQTEKLIAMPPLCPSRNDGVIAKG